MNIVKFAFDAGQALPVEIRTVQNEVTGDNWFVLRDVLEAMGSTTTTTNAIESVNQGLGDGFVAGIPLATVGGSQETKIVAEAAATYLISRSNTEQGRKLNRFIHVDVLPELRKTGQFSFQSKESALQEKAARQLRAELEIASLLSIPLHIAQLEAVKAVHRETGIDYRQLLAHSPAQSNVLPAETMLEPADLAKRLNIKDGATVNTWLAQHGLQTRQGKSWEPTELGKRYSVGHQWVTQYKSGINYKWSLTYVKSLLPSDWITNDQEA